MKDGPDMRPIVLTGKAATSAADAIRRSHEAGKAKKIAKDACSMAPVVKGMEKS